MNPPRLLRPSDLSVEKWIEACGLTVSYLVRYSEITPVLTKENAIRFWAMQAWSHALDLTGERDKHQPIIIRNNSERSQKTENLYDID